MLGMLGIAAAYVLVLRLGFGIIPARIEAIATVFGIIQMDLFRREKPAAFIFSILYCAFLAWWFASIGLYGQVAMRGAFIVINLFGIYFWLRPRIVENKELEPTWLPNKIRLPIYGAFIVIGSLGAALYGLRASADWLYALMALTGQVFISKKKIDCWVLWLAADTFVGLPLFFIAGSWMYLLLIGFMIINGFVSIKLWGDEGRKQK